MTKTRAVKKRPTSKPASKSADDTDIVAKALAGYAERGVFRGYSQLETKGEKTDFRVVWHRDRAFDLSFQPRSRTLRFAAVLEEMPASSPLYVRLRSFVDERLANDLPEHRRIDPKRAKIVMRNSGGRVSLAVTAARGDSDYATRKLIHLVHEIYMVFLMEGECFEYLVQTFDLDPDHM